MKRQELRFDRSGMGLVVLLFEDDILVDTWPTHIDPGPSQRVVEAMLTEIERLQGLAPPGAMTFHLTPGTMTFHLTPGIWRVSVAPGLNASIVSKLEEVTLAEGEGDMVWGPCSFYLDEVDLGSLASQGGGPVAPVRTLGALDAEEDD